VALSEVEPARAHAPAAPARGAVSSAEHGSPAYRPYLDGLRAVAILGVLVYHLDRAWLPGGYLGVDLFFVLSGYLITMLLLGEHARTGRIDLPAFWSRRIRRLLPALLVLLVVMAALIWVGGDLLAQGRARGDLLATLFYFANWQFIAEGQSYFNQFVAASPDRHTWSLAIEEQFYLAWPLVAAFVLGRFKALGLAVVAGTVAVGSALWLAVLFDPVDPSRAYFGTDSRIFEILVGASLAIALAGRFRARLVSVGRLVAPIALLALIAAYVGLADDNALYYRGGAVLVCLAAAALIAGLEGGSPVARLLSVRPLVLVGLVSYGLYLWHFPIITYVNEWLGPTSLPQWAALATGLTVAATVVSYVVVETPIRRRGMLVGLRLTPRRLVGVVPAASGVVAIAIVVSTAGAVYDPNWNAAVSPTGIAIATPSRTAAPSATVLATGSAGPGATTAPSPSPTGAGGPGWVVGVVGDSVMVSLSGALASSATARGWTFVSAAEAACPVGYQQLYQLDGSKLNACPNVRSLHDQLIAAHPDVIVWHDLQSSLARMSGTGKLLLPGGSGWEASLLAEWTMVIGRLHEEGAEVVVVLPPWRSQYVAGCGGVGNPARCLEIQSEDTNIRKATRDFVASLGGVSWIHLVTMDSLLCPNGYPCPRRVGDIEVRFPGWDQTHFTEAGAAWMAPRLLDMVVAAVNRRT
jgi:peptidoglycan/LPS O-acetylase OafA/YrhL